MRMYRLFNVSLFTLFVLCSTILVAQESEIVYLSGHGYDDAFEWDFYCTDGRMSGSWARIPVPSCWEQQGFGTYNYGHDPDSLRGKEMGHYKLNFKASPEWKNKSIIIVFEGSMTDTEVKVNGKTAGEIHQGGFYRFSYDISRLVKFNSDNLLEVTVSKHSHDNSVNQAERYADYWIFGGIYRPVYLEIRPIEHINRMAIDARADGEIAVDAYLNNIKSANLISARIMDSKWNQIGQYFEEQIDRKTNKVTLKSRLADILPWSPEFPNLYYLEMNLKDDDEVLHTVRERFGFRTVEVRERDGIYVNGEKIKFKGVCRHSFWPESGRTLSKDLSIQDVQLMKDMNMNAVRMSHYPPDPHFLDVCDSLGLFVLDELAGWQASYNTEAGRKLVREMVTRDVNHPSIIIWDNGNEGGWNTDLDEDFEKYDPQKRVLIHPWEKFRLTDTNHYIDYNYGTNDSFNGHHIFFPTEVLHGLFDGGHGAGLEDFWKLMWETPVSAGCFLWVFSDEAVKRTDKDGFLDTDGNHAPDGILGPYREKEGSFYTIKEIWSPVYFKDKYITGHFDGKFDIQNRYHFTNLNQCSFTYRLLRFPGPDVADSGGEIIEADEIDAPDIPPGGWGVLEFDLPANWEQADALYITANDPYGRELFTWDWPISVPEDMNTRLLNLNPVDTCTHQEGERFVRFITEGIQIELEKESGILARVLSDEEEVSLGGGPVLAEGSGELVDYTMVSANGSCQYKANFRGNLKSIGWTLLGNGLVKLEVIYVPNNYQPYYGINFNYPEDKVDGIRWLGNGPYRVWKNRLRGVTLNVWEKDYNNTITGETYDYPEFKGYHSDLYWITLRNKEKDFKIYSMTENLFFRLYTPADPQADPRHTKVAFPEGDISFLHAINAIGTKFKSPELLGPQSQLNMYRRHPTDDDLQITLYFDFR